jgi:hypothetical protein
MGINTHLVFTAASRIRHDTMVFTALVGLQNVASNEPFGASPMPLG